MNTDKIMFHLINAIDINNSPIKLRDGGALIFAMQNINHQNVVLGLEENILLSEIIFRV